MPRLPLWLLWVFFWVTLTVHMLFATWLVTATSLWLTRFNDSVTLPNGLVLKRELDFPRRDRDDLFAADGKTVLARDVEFVCFNDRFIMVHSYDRRHSGMYDARTGRRVEGEQARRDSGLSSRHGCNGYYTGMVGAGLLYDGNEAPFLPNCSWRNVDRARLGDRSWFERPCDGEDWGTRGIP